MRQFEDFEDDDPIQRIGFFFPGMPDPPEEPELYFLWLQGLLEDPIGLNDEPEEEAPRAEDDVDIPY